MKISLRLLPLTLLFVVLLSTASGQVVPTNEWVHFYSANTTLNSSPIPVGALIDAYDPDGVHCGADTVRTAGEYGFMNVYADDNITTPGVDEGADEGDDITFYINGVLATPLGPDDANYVSTFAILEVDLGVSYELGILLTAPSDDGGSPNTYVDYSFALTNTGEGIDFFHLDAWSEGTWTAELISPATTGYMNSGSVTMVTVRHHIPGSALPFETDILHLSATSAMSLESTILADTAQVTTTAETSAAGDHDPFIPGVFELFQNYPNPFNPTTRIEFSLERAMDVELSVYNVIGQKIATLTDGFYSAGTYDIEWDATDETGRKVASGIYFYRLTTDDYSRTRKMMLMK
ncbi:MAG: T9SS type A sorting domain-containing protein [candidate division Zixibacteria bacterium]|nr:T9SS type A sorting domain-containing protein [candidate division Zixibacteria bacterium]MBU1470382.1 T9SS type A sorting domain-containing protein [candidate division Zixibacteria bacterium]MBU2624252.1 T9SS type A sorting domain-containing protein [candidate division Zixibacteria bacterium]